MRTLIKFIIILLLTGCSHHKSIEFVYGDWPIDNAIANLVKVIIEENYNTDVQLMLTNSAGAWASISTGTSDISMSAWLPVTHKYYYANTKDRVDIVRPIFSGTEIGLAVPAYVPIDSIDELESNAAKFDNEIIGIDPGAGIMVEIERAMKVYNLSRFSLVDSSEAVMLGMLKERYKNNEWVVIAAWKPHEMFHHFNLKFLLDPKGVFGGQETIYTIVRLGFREDHPAIYRFLQNFEITEEELTELIDMNKANREPYQNAKDWVKAHQKRIEGWVNN